MSHTRVSRSLLGAIIASLVFPGDGISLSLSDAALLRQQAFIGGKWCDADDGGSVAVVNPATAEVLAQIPDMAVAETRRAISAAEAAFPAWCEKTGKERGAVLRRWHDLIMEAQEDLAILMTAEQGKPLAEARGEIAYGASFVEWYAEEAKRVYGDVIPQTKPGTRIVVTREPVGVVGAITPWNFPSAMIVRKCSPALAVGCTCVVKPSELTPLSALALCVLAERAGMPAGVFNIVTTNRPSEVGGELTANRAVRKLGFTGSTAVGKLLMAQCASTVKKLSLELGGNAPFIVFDDADVASAVAGAVASKFRNTGQTCVCANRILVQAGVYDDFVAGFAKAVASMKQGNGFDEGVTLGPLIDRRAFDKVDRLVQDAMDKGATLVAGGSLSTLGSTFYAPTILTGATSDMACFHEEIFGPVAPVYKFETEDDAVRLANDTPYGLAAYFYSRDLGRVWRVAEALDYGMVGINEGVIATEVAPFGGVKESGLGREGSHMGLDEFVEPKYMLIGGLS